MLQRLSHAQCQPLMASRNAGKFTMKSRGDGMQKQSVKDSMGILRKEKPTVCKSCRERRPEALSANGVYHEKGR